MSNKFGYRELSPQALVRIIKPTTGSGKSRRDEFDLAYLMRHKGIRVHQIAFNITKRTVGPSCFMDVWPCPREILMATVYYELTEEQCKQAGVFVSKNKYTDILPAYDVNWDQRKQLNGKNAKSIAIRLDSRVLSERWRLTYSKVITDTSIMPLIGEEIDWYALDLEQRKQDSERLQRFIDDLDVVDDAFEGDSSLWQQHDL